MGEALINGTAQANYDPYVAQSDCEMRRQAREQKQKQELERQRNERLIALLGKFISRHYANPATGRYGAILSGPVGALIFHAASLRALLIENEPVW